MTYIQEIYENVIDGQNKAVQEKVQAAINAEWLQKKSNEGMIAAMAEVDRLLKLAITLSPKC